MLLYYLLPKAENMATFGMRRETIISSMYHFLMRRKVIVNKLISGYVVSTWWYVVSNEREMVCKSFRMVGIWSV